MTDWYAPNQQAVREDGSGPAEEGTGGTAAEPEPQDAGDGLDDLTKDELIQTASERGVDVSASMTKDEIKAAIRAG